ncbi:hypothetical protein VP1G_00801 [Cytospora mali]|uniref:Uncharacterized protein n=1 Tax=Cytospora mali TaxID=578113 RepID=A0A194UNG5_CYTMA|nr:hypothetical protein VP1G_00801 [Valsa mali var. pyri (nom. inval.)]
MIIANQNINGDDLAARLNQIHRDDNQHPIGMIKVNNLDTERDELIRAYGPQRDVDFHEGITMADILDAGNDDETLDDFVARKGDFAPLTKWRYCTMCVARAAANALEECGSRRYDPRGEQKRHNLGLLE